MGTSKKLCRSWRSVLQLPVSQHVPIAGTVNSKPPLNTVISKHHFQATTDEVVPHNHVATPWIQVLDPCSWHL